MMKKWMGILMIMSLIFPLFGQTNVDTTKSEKNKYWKFTGLVSLNFSETMQWNWAAGGNNNGNGILAANVKLVYKKDKIAWETTFDSDYGWMWAPSTNFKWRKSS